MTRCEDGWSSDEVLVFHAQIVWINVIMIGERKGEEVPRPFFNRVVRAPSLIVPPILSFDPSGINMMAASKDGTEGRRRRMSMGGTWRSVNQHHMINQDSECTERWRRWIRCMHPWMDGCKWPLPSAELLGSNSLLLAAGRSRKLLAYSMTAA